jgi:hypothetical protein
MRSGEAPAAWSPPGASAQPPSSGEALGDETPEGPQAPQPGPSGVDPEEQERIKEEEPFNSDPTLLVRLLEGWADAMDAVEVDVLGPLLLDNEIKRIDEAVERIAAVARLLRRWRDES